jgi:D-alanyl-D-alanine carboxypeptidase/D-alanyl-D-alanine-endopeptidase (penicillin-binding protein 4)
MIRLGPVVALLAGLMAARAVTPPAGPSTSAPPPSSPSAAVLNLRADIERLISRPNWRGAQWSVTVVSLDRGDTLVAHAPDLALAPASNMKLFTTAAALYYLGAQYRYTTFLLADGSIENGVLQGDLIVYGTGDPTFSDRFHQKMAPWNAFADTLAALGIREVRGNIVADASYFGGSGTATGWQEDYMNASYAAPASALSFAENVATLHIKPAAEVGARPEVRLIPGGEGIAIQNEATTVQRGRTWVHAMRTSYNGPVLLRGQVAKNTLGMIRTVVISDPPRWAGAVLRETLQKRGINVTGQVTSVETGEESPLTGRMIFAPAFSDRPPVRVLAMHESPPLIDILEVVNKKSHNLLAEQTLRTVGRVALGEGTVEAGARAVQHLLTTEAQGFAPNVQIYDGSGLSVLNRVTTRSIIHLLSFMAKSPMWEDFWYTLPEAGARDGLSRMGGTAAVHNLRAKTGTIDNVSALSGYVRAANGERLAFSIISNNVPSTWPAKRIEDAIGARLANFDRAVEEPMSGEAAAASSTDSTAASAPTPAPAPMTRPRASSRESTRGTTSTSARTYTIKKGDTLDRIARNHRTTVAALQRANPGLSPRRLIPGKKIKLP